MDSRFISDLVITPNCGALSYVRISENGKKLRSVGHSRYDLIVSSVSDHIEDIVEPNPIAKHNPTVGREDGYIQFAFFKIHHLSKVRTLNRISTVFVHEHMITAIHLYDCSVSFLPGEARDNETLSQIDRLPIFWRKDVVYHGFCHKVDYECGGVPNINESALPTMYRIFGTSFTATDTHGRFVTGKCWEGHHG